MGTSAAPARASKRSAVAFCSARLVVAGQRHGYTNQLHGRSMCQNIGPTSHDGTDKPKDTKMTSFGMAPNERRARDWKARSRHVDNGTCVSENYSDRGAIDKAPYVQTHWLLRSPSRSLHGASNSRAKNRSEPRPKHYSAVFGGWGMIQTHVSTVGSP